MRSNSVISPLRDMDQNTPPKLEKLPIKAPPSSLYPMQSFVLNSKSSGQIDSFPRSAETLKQHDIAFIKHHFQTSNSSLHDSSTKTSETHISLDKGQMTVKGNKIDTTVT